jgi:hypothetical protein
MRLLICGQWPYTSFVMLRELDDTLADDEKRAKAEPRRATPS